MDLGWTGEVPLAKRCEPLAQLGDRRLGALGVDACEVHVLGAARLEGLGDDLGQRRPVWKSKFHASVMNRRVGTRRTG